MIDKEKITIWALVWVTVCLFGICDAASYGGKCNSTQTCTGNGVVCSIDTGADGTCVCNSLFYHTSTDRCEPTRECHPDSYPTPLNGIKTCTASGFGYVCTITCNNGYLIKGSGTTKTVTCSTGVSWAESDVVTDCVRDQTPPDLQCPTSLVVQISNINDVVQIDCAANANYAPLRNVDSGVPVGSNPILQYFPSSLTLSQTNVNTVFTITLRSIDRGGNSATCDFYVTVEVPICSYFSLPDISNGQKTCTARTGLNTGFDCTLTCNNGYTFPITTNNARIYSITTSCNTGSPFTGAPVMNCVSAIQNTVSPVFTGYIEYDYQTSDGTINIPSTCDQMYVDTLKARSSDFTAQSTQFTVVCKAILEIPTDTLLSFQLLPNETKGTVITGGGTNTNIVRMRYYYTMLSTNATYFMQCEDVIRNLTITGKYKLDGFTTRETILNTGVICPPVAYFANSVTLTRGIYKCSQNYFRTESACVPCPSGSVRPVANSDSKCEQCQVGYYRDVNMGICTACPTGTTTRYLGTLSISQCIAACAPGFVSTTGNQPCYRCAKGSYSVRKTTCTSCPIGQSTTSVGASSSAECIVSSYTALGKQVFYLANEGESPGKGANTVVSYMHHYLHHYGLGEEEAVFHFDNCAGQNKNNCVLWYALWRVIVEKGLGESCTLASQCSTTSSTCSGGVCACNTGYVDNNGEATPGGSCLQGVPMVVVNETSNPVVVLINQEQTTIALSIAEAFLYDRTNREIRRTALVGCRHEMCDFEVYRTSQIWKVSDIDNLDNWKEASAKGYTAWRITKNDWWTKHTDNTGRRRRNLDSTKNFTVGSENCGGVPDNDYCNGPLVANTSFVFVVVVCISGGCLLSQDYGPYRTKAFLSGDSVTKESNVEMIAGVTIGVSAAVIVVIVIVIAFFRRKMVKQPTAKMSVNYIKEKKFEHRPVRLIEFSSYLTYLKKDSNQLFSAEYEEMESRSPSHATNAANLQENRSKNRLPNIVPYDHSRVKLSIISEDNKGDYINANYFPGYNSSREYIGCQGPLASSVDDMWRMIWEQNVTIVVMLTPCMEGNKNKCEQYWPINLGEQKWYGDVIVDVISETNMGFYDLRIMRISNGDQTRELKHFHFLIWRENLATVKHDLMLNFIQRVRESMPPIEGSGPVVVHCSAGVGGTGTYIALDHLIQFINNHDLQAKIDIFDLVLKLRNNRCHMVQTQQQYIFIHECVSKLLDEKYGAHINRDPANDAYSCLNADTMQGNSEYEELSNM